MNKNNCLKLKENISKLQAYNKALEPILKQYIKTRLNRKDLVGLRDKIKDLIKETKDLIPTSPDQAKEIFGNDFLGREAVKKAFGIDIPKAEIPAIPFSREDLERARELGQFLILRYNKAPDGQPLSMKKMNDMLEKQFKKKN